MRTRDYFVWVEKYRPQTIGECILPNALATTLANIVKQKDCTNLLFHGRAGVGKTTVAKALARELNADAMIINASDDNGIDVIRDRIKDFASSASLTGERKYVILDEADMLTFAAQPALRAFIEEFAHNCGFIFTCNNLQRIIEPLHSRCSVIDFTIPTAERQAICLAYLKRCEEILGNEGVTFDKKVLAQVIANYFPDMRRILNELQRHTVGGKLSEGILAQLTDKDLDQLFGALKKKEFTGLRKWLTAHEDMDETAFYRMLYTQVAERIDPSCLPEAVVLMADYAYRAALSADKQLNALACLVELMNGGSWR
jgi:DNA polymerase III delta prime subunit